jgi:hypothetical protein
VLRRSVKFNTWETGAAAMATVGHLYAGRQVIQIADAGDGIAITFDGGETRLVPAGSVVTAEPVDSPPVPPVVRRRVRCAEAVGRRPAVIYHTGLPGQEVERRVAVGDTLDEFGSYVEQIIVGDPCRVLLKSGQMVEFSAGALVRFLP